MVVQVAVDSGAKVVDIGGEALVVLLARLEATLRAVVHRKEEGTDRIRVSQNGPSRLTN